MRKFILTLGAFAVALPAVAVLPASGADARRSQYREWRGRDGRVYCRKSNGTTGLVVGGVAGALVGRTIDTGGDRTVGTLGGAALGALAGRAVERNTGNNRHCQ
ncbi:glycine zipper 2TM domain-containing protein [Sphingomonas sp.]|uniref:glycine zipper 2TM domain-containing protein n=1 Tax=Sphingomonas sp. TaxID=28214 RepID=UPI003CC62D33